MKKKKTLFTTEEQMVAACAAECAIEQEIRRKRLEIAGLMRKLRAALAKKKKAVEGALHSGLEGPRRTAESLLYHCTDEMIELQIANCGLPIKEEA